MSSKLNINRNIFLEKEELVRFQSFLENNTVNQVMLENTSSWGIVRTVFTGTSPDFKIEVGTNAGTVKLALASKAVDKNRMLIKSPVFDNLAVPNDGAWYWMKVSHQFSNLEVGTCSIAVDGEVSGAGTLFTEVVRGQATEVPVKIKFWKSSGLVNTDTYEVIDVSGDGTLTLVGDSFSVETGLNYFVVGSTPIGEALTSDQELGLYFYDSSLIEFVAETTTDTEPAGLVEDIEFYLARVKNSSNVITLTDKRTQFITFNVEGMADKLTTLNYLSEFSSTTAKAAARANLNVLSAEESVALSNQVDSGWLNFTAGVAAVAGPTTFDLKIRRVGKLCIVQGFFVGGSNTNVDAVIGSVVLANLFVTGETPVKPSQSIYFSPGVIITSGINQNTGMFGYINPTLDTTALNLRVNAYAGAQAYRFNINFSFFLD